MVRYHLMTLAFQQQNAIYERDEEQPQNMLTKLDNANTEKLWKERWKVLNTLFMRLLSRWVYSGMHQNQNSVHNQSMPKCNTKQIIPHQP